MADEPTENEMRAAVEAHFGQANDAADETARRCNNREFKQGQGDPLLAMQCLAYGMGAGVTDGGSSVRAPKFSLTRFEKIACEKAQGKAGYVCDYVIGYGTNMPSIPAETIGRQGAASQSRFVQRNDSWVMLEQ